MLEEYKCSNGAILIPATKSSPEIYLNPASGDITIKGSSFNENSIDFYYGVMRWLMEYSRNPAPTTEINLCFHYLNSHSTITFMRILQLMENLIAARTEFIVNWYYENDDEDMHDLAHDFNNALKTPINIIPFSIEELDELTT